ncbi:MAG TPA: BBP7 family outer membrane beta-barrel protein, partial [Gemmataceae bacterium]
ATLTGPATLAVTDRFETRNQFYGPAVGGWFEWRKGKWVGLINGKVGLGVMHQVVQVSGETRGVPAGGTATTVPGGLLAQPSNIGRTVRDVFAAVPEAGVRIGYRFTDRLMGSIGYSFLYASDVVRPGDQIDPVVAPGQVPASSAFGTPGPNRPGRLFRQNDFWAHGFTVGLTCSY